MNSNAIVPMLFEVHAFKILSSCFYYFSSFPRMLYKSHCPGSMHQCVQIKKMSLSAALHALHFTSGLGYVAIQKFVICDVFFC